MNWGISTRKKTKLRAQITIITLVLFSFILNACPPLEEDPADSTLVYKGPLDLNKWMDALHSIEKRGLPITLDLSDCTVPDSGGDVLKIVLEDGSDVPPGYTGTTYIQFNPFSGFQYGKELITAIILPKAATMISHAAETDIKVITDDDKKWAAFRHFKRLRSVTGENILLIGNLAFIDCESLEEIKLSRAVKISQYAFYGCTALKEANFEVARDIRTSAFENCSSLERVNFPSVGNISQNAFKSCESLIEVSFDVAAKIGEDAFRDCVSLKSARFRANPDRTTDGDPVLDNSNKVTDDSVVFYENALRGCKSLEILDIRYAWNVFFFPGALADIGENLDLFLFDDDGTKCYGHPQSEMFLGDIRGSEEKGKVTVKNITIRAPVVSPPENSQIMSVNVVKGKTGLRHFINTVYNAETTPNEPENPLVKVSIQRESPLQ